MQDFIKIRGARQHNLKNINLDIPKYKFVVITGVSGSGKSSLAFDTIYAEGQRRYVESLSSYARQFLGIMDKPEVDEITGLSPSISIDQKAASQNPRSTVGTITEIYDYLRLLYARVGHPHCPNCRIEIRKLTLDEIVERILVQIKLDVAKDKIVPHSFSILSPVVRRKKGEFRELFTNLKNKGFSKLFIDKKPFTVDDDLTLVKTNKHDVDVVTDSFNLSHKDLKNEVFTANIKSRLTTAIEQALNLSSGLVILNCKNDHHLFSENFSCPNCNISLPEVEPRMFSFNSPLGACEKCKGIGNIFKIDSKLVLNPNLSINEGGVTPFSNLALSDTWYTRLIKTVCEEEGINLDIPTSKIEKEKLNILLYGTGNVYIVPGKNRFGRDTEIHEKYDGIIGELERRYFDSDSVSFGEIHKYMREEICDKCKGLRLKPEILAITIDNMNISDFSERSVDAMYDYCSVNISKILSIYEQKIAVQILREIIVRLNFLRNVGLSYLTIARPAKTLSGGELQRIRLASQIGTGLTGVLYVLDEPSIGLHPKDVSALIQTLRELTKLGNTLIVVEHDRETIENADYLIELGPRAGKLGGKVEFSGTLPQLKKAKVLTGEFLSGKRKISLTQKPISSKFGTLKLKGARQFNLKNIDVNFPLGNLIVVTGVSGSGKSTLIVETLYPALKYYLDGYFNEKIGKFDHLDGYQYIDRVYLVDQSPIGRTPRSNPATYTGFFDEIREIFSETIEAKTRGFKKGRFSFNIRGGRCEKCQGAGVIKIEMQFLADVYVTCDVCGGKRYNSETLQVLFKGKNIFEVLQMTVDDAFDFFSSFPKIAIKLAFLKSVGLGYIELGQQAPTFSGGEAQRIKLANELSRRDTGKTLYILDEPTTGLHFYDIVKLLSTLNQLVERGNTVVIIEHNLDVIKNCQYIIDLGPQGGDGGGQLVYEGELDKILKVKSSHTAKYLQHAID